MSPLSLSHAAIGPKNERDDDPEADLAFVPTLIDLSQFRKVHYKPLQALKVHLNLMINLQRLACYC